MTVPEPLPFLYPPLMVGLGLLAELASEDRVSDEVADPGAVNFLFSLCLSLAMIAIL